MKIFLYNIITFILSVNTCSPQSTNELSNMIIESMKKHIVQMEQQIEKGVLTKTYLEKIVFLKDNFPEDFPFQETMEKMGINFFEESQYSRAELKAGINVFRLQSAILKNDTFTLTIVNYKLSKKNKRIFLYNCGGITYTYKYLCDTKQWILKN